jgi:hypothetical protein
MIRVFSTEKIVEDITKWPEEKRATVKFAREEEIDGNKKLFAVYPKGTEFFGKQADQLIALGKARIVDDTPRIENAEVAE